LATGDTMSSIAFAYRIGLSTVSMIISETCESLWDVFQNELFKPSEDGWKEVAKKFDSYWNFPHCIGALDGKHVILKVIYVSNNLVSIFINLYSKIILF